MRPAVRALGLLAATLLVASCGAAAPTGAAMTPAGSGPSPAIVPPEAGLTSAEAASVALLRTALVPLGLQLSSVAKPVQPSEPLALLAVPRVVYRIELADPDQGYVFIYDFPDGAAAAGGARQLAQFLGSGLGLATYPGDAQFSVSQAGSNVIFTWWSAQRSSDPARAGAAFRAVASVGQAVPITR